MNKLFRTCNCHWVNSDEEAVHETIEDLSDEQNPDSSHILVLGVNLSIPKFSFNMSVCLWHIIFINFIKSRHFSIFLDEQFPKWGQEKSKADAKLRHWKEMEKKEHFLLWVYFKQKISL